MLAGSSAEQSIRSIDTHRGRSGAGSALSKHVCGSACLSAIQYRAGKELYRSQDIVTEPADKIHAETGAHDPDWAMYSVFLDSAYYGFSQLQSC